MSVCEALIAPLQGAVVCLCTSEAELPWGVSELHGVCIEPLLVAMVWCTFLFTAKS